MNSGILRIFLFLLTGAEVQLTAEDGKTQHIEIPAGTTFWSEEETHQVINTSEGFYLSISRRAERVSKSWLSNSNLVVYFLNCIMKLM
jgi:hypothetical protein